ncbi:hypothetical protein LBWT_Y0390 (plasmid) [Leptolyngbya boryana IAM M-101]|nr:hypothetical protein LBWT_Y0390 [Leptolyngbya boryana IAM M-101]BAS66799.1 hypothetical protein LBDG_Y0390 [Leptolyngbya boryana dg5]
MRIQVESTSTCNNCGNVLIDCNEILRESAKSRISQSANTVTIAGATKG